MGGERSDQLNADLDTGLRDLLAPDLVTGRWAAVVEILDSDGDRAIWLLAAPGSTAWDILGMLEFAREINLRRAEE